MPVRLVLDRNNEEFGVVHSTGPGTIRLAQHLNDSPICFCATWAVAVCHRDGTRKISVLLAANLQVDLIFKTCDEEYAFLIMLKGLATTSLTLYEVPQPTAKSSDPFLFANFSMIKSGYVGAGNAEALAAVHDLGRNPYKQFYGRNEWADYTVIAQGEEFPVHKLVICSQSSFFAAACRPGFLEGATGRLELEEDPATIEALIGELYGARNAVTGSIFTGFALIHELEKDYRLRVLLKLCIAADKYNLETIKVRTAEAIADRLELVQDPWIVVDYANEINDYMPENDDNEGLPKKDAGLRETILEHIEARLPAVKKDPAAYEYLLQSPFILEGLVNRLSEIVENGVFKLHKHIAGLPTSASSATKTRRSNRLSIRDLTATP
ncbi:hypothetical protein B0J11DRAFT_444580 [Dendryphion nanum]|uniref:BTB domain-containing protein n=1 Tax=Dendryphion nanum TaxID=256645 RepID=A0A9P9D9C2_9PLEO|nr:hypothetical protein B0J11DRAFT_444580 [Dendryphion nanum]